MSQQIQPQCYASSEVETLNESKKDIVMALIKQIKIGMEIKHIVLPCFLLQPRSLLESFTDMFACLDELYKIPEIENQEERFIQVLKFYFSWWHARPKGIKKPFNPVIGEVFDCKYRNPVDEEDVGVFVAEQISHHPPLSAYCFYNKKREIVINGNVTPSYVKYYGNSAESHLKGILTFHFLKLNETYEITLPTIGVKGVLIGKISSFINGKVQIKLLNSTYQANCEFLSKSLIGSSKKQNGIRGEVYHQGKTIYKIKGNWDSQIYLNKEHPPSKEDIKLFDVHDVKRFYPEISPYSEQPPNSSYHLWEEVTKNIKANNDQGTAAEKAKIENKQRVEEAERNEKHIQWIPENFIHRPYNQENQNTYVYKELESIFPNHFSSNAKS
eukprot:gene4106-5137_t